MKQRKKFQQQNSITNKKANTEGKKSISVFLDFYFSRFLAKILSYHSDRETGAKDHKPSEKKGRQY